jgi:hypothetical protein
MKNVVRDFFIQTFNQLVDTGDVATTEARSERYQSMLSHYMDVVDENSCGCFNKPEDVINEIKKLEVEIKEFIVNGKTVQPR